MGVRGVFEIIRETWHSHPQLCVKALQSFLDLLQGQAPSGLKYEPKDITGKPVHVYQAKFFLAIICMIWKILGH